MNIFPENMQAKHERECQLLTENALECIWTYDIGTEKFTYVSPSVIRLRGFTVDETMRQSLADMMPQDSLDKANNTTKLLMERYQNGERIYDCGFSFV